MALKTQEQKVWKIEDKTERVCDLDKVYAYSRFHI